MALCKVRAAIKINLFLHVIARQSNGFHRLQSAFLFLPEGDEVSLAPAEADHLCLDGPEAAQLGTSSDNILTRTKNWFFEWLAKDSDSLQITLTKNIPIASGVGGGSADAAALLHLLANRYHVPVERHDDLILQSGFLGADVPVCLTHQLGRGDLFFLDGSGKTEPILNLFCDLFHTGAIVLINPREQHSTADAFSQLQHFSRPLSEDITSFSNADAFLTFLTQQKNDFEYIAIARHSPLEGVLSAMRKAAPLARLSGTGLTCWAWTPHIEEAQKLATNLQQHYPHAWVRTIPLNQPDHKTGAAA